MNRFELAKCRCHRGCVALSLLLASNGAHAWEDHALGTVAALQSIPEISEAQRVKVESIESFLWTEQTNLSAWLDQEEIWAVQNVSSYPARPENLRFDALPGEDATRLRVKFLRALRVNPEVKVALFAQTVPGRHTDSSAALTPLRFADVSTVPAPGGYPDYPFASLKEGDDIAPFDTVLAARDEPDYGLDIGLWSDNGTTHGAEYGFGKQPFGNPAFPFSSQAPFHMGFYHESGVVYAAAGFLKRTYPEYRIHLYKSLSQFAFQSGHPYWGWRFAGWALHYVQDLTQPYHASVLPGVSVPFMLGVNLLDLLGLHGPKSKKVQLISNRHFALENFQYFTLRSALESGDANDPVLNSLSSPSEDHGFGSYTDSYPRDVITIRSRASAADADQILGSSLPVLLVNDPEYIFGQTDPAINVVEVILSAGDPGRQASMSLLLQKLMHEFGVHSRIFARAWLTP